MTQAAITAAVRLTLLELKALCWVCCPLCAGLFLPASAFKSVRRAAADQLLTLRQQHDCDTGMAQQPVLPQLLAEAAAAQPTSSSSNVDVSKAATPGAKQRRPPQQHIVKGPELRVLCRTPGQVDAALKLPWLDEIIVDFLEVHGLKEAVAAVQAAGKQVIVALPRILKPGETSIGKVVACLFYILAGHHE